MACRLSRSPIFFFADNRRLLSGADFHGVPSARISLKASEVRNIFILKHRKTNTLPRYFSDAAAAATAAPAKTQRQRQTSRRAKCTCTVSVSVANVRVHPLLYLIDNMAAYMPGQRPAAALCSVKDTRKNTHSFPRGRTMDGSAGAFAISSKHVRLTGALTCQEL